MDDHLIMELHLRGEHDNSPMQSISADLLAHYRNVEVELRLLKAATACDVLTPGAIALGGTFDEINYISITNANKEDR